MKLTGNLTDRTPVALFEHLFRISKPDDMSDATFRNSLDDCLRVAGTPQGAVELLADGPLAPAFGPAILRESLAKWRNAREKKRATSKRRRTPKRTQPTARQAQALELFNRRHKYEEIGNELGISKQAAEALVKRGLESLSSSGRSVRAQAHPTDDRGQVTSLRRNRRGKGR